LCGGEAAVSTNHGSSSTTIARSRGSSRWDS
jgi:hypothetical protein